VKMGVSVPEMDATNPAAKSMPQSTYEDWPGSKCSAFRLRTTNSLINRDLHIRYAKAGLQEILPDGTFDLRRHQLNTRTPSNDRQTFHGSNGIAER